LLKQKTHTPIFQLPLSLIDPQTSAPMKTKHAQVLPNMLHSFFCSNTYQKQFGGFILGGGIIGKLPSGNRILTRMRLHNKNPIGVTGIM